MFVRDNERSIFPVQCMNLRRCVFVYLRRSVTGSMAAGAASGAGGCHVQRGSPRRGGEVLRAAARAIPDALGKASSVNPPQTSAIEGAGCYQH